MPTKFNYGTDLKPTDAPQRALPSSYSGQPENVDAVNGQVVGSIIDQIADRGTGRADAALGAYTVEALDVVNASAKYKTEKDRIIATLATADPNDRAAVERYNIQLDRLRKGEVQGTLSPSEAQLRINNLTKQSINAYPAMTKKFLEIRSSLGQDLPKIGTDIEADPEVQATNELIKTSRANGWALPDQIAYNKSIMIADTQKRTLEAKLRAGSAAEADVQAMVLAQTGQVYAHLMADMGNLQTDPNDRGANYQYRLLTTRGTMEQTVRQNLVQAQIDYGFKFSPDFMDKTVASAVAPLDELIKISDKLDNPKTRAETAQFILGELRANSQISLIKRLGPGAALANSTEDLMKYVGTISKYRQQIQHNQRPEIEARAAQGDVEAGLMLSIIDGNDFDTALANAIKNTAEGKQIDKASTDTEDKMRAQVSINAALDPKTDKASSEKMLATLAARQDAFEAWDNRRDVTERTKLFPQVQESLRQNAARQNAAAITHLNPEDFSRIQFDALNKEQPFSVSTTMLSADQGTGGVPGGVYGDKLRYISPKTKAFVEDLNQQYRVLSQFTPRPDIQKWAATTLDDMKVHSDSTTAPEPAAPATEAPAPAPVAPVEATVTKQGDVSFGRFSVARTTYAIRDNKTNRELSPPALERLRTQLSGTQEGEELETALEFSYSTEENDNGTGN